MSRQPQPGGAKPEHTPSILRKIAAQKRRQIEKSKRALPKQILVSDLPKEPARDFPRALREASEPAIIAEVKKASPSKGDFHMQRSVVEQAQAYAEGGAAALSVLTDAGHFNGSFADLRRVRARVACPVLRKDFIIDPYQIYESRYLGADGVLLIASLLSQELIGQFLELVHRLGMTALVEVHTAHELASVLKLQPKLIGINNRNLHTFETRLSVTEELLASVDERPEDTLIVSESGVASRSDIERLAQAGADAFLIGEALVRADDPRAHLKHLRGVDGEH